MASLLKPRNEPAMDVAACVCAGVLDSVCVCEFLCACAHADVDGECGSLCAGVRLCAV